MVIQVLDVVFEVFDQIGQWITGMLDSLTGIFWHTNAEGIGELTFLGVLALCGLGFSVVFLIIGIIQRFLHFRG